MPTIEIDLPNGKTAEVDMPDGENPDTFVPHAAQMIMKQEGGEQPGFMSRVGKGIQKGVTEFIPNIARQASNTLAGGADLLATALQNPSELLKYDAEKPYYVGGKLVTAVPDIAKGAASGLTLGAYQPEPGTTDPRYQAIGETGANYVFNKPLQPVLKAVAPLARPLINAGVGAVQGGISAGVQGGDVAEGIGQGIGSSATGEIGFNAARGVGAVAGTPFRQAISKMAQTEVAFADRMSKYGQALNDVTKAEQQNKVSMAAYDLEVGKAKAELAANVAGARDRLGLAIDQRSRAQTAFDESVKGAADQARKLRPALAPEQAYAEFNRLRDTAPQTLPEIVLTNTTANVGKQSSRILESTSNLPRAAGIGAVDPVEKLAVGLDSVMQDSKQANVSDVGGVATFGERWKTFSPEMKQLANEKYTSQIGISGDDIASMTSGRLRLDQFDRMRQLVGEKAGAGSGLASSIYHSMMEDLRSSSDPMAKGYVAANRSYGQNIAAMDLTRMVLPARDKFGHETIDTTKLNNVKKMFDVYDRDPKLLKFDERQIVESIPQDQRRPFLEYIDTIFKKRTTLDTLKQDVKAARAELGTALKAKPAKVEKPNLASTTLPDLSQYGPLDKYPDMQFDSPLGFGATYSMNRAAGLPISWSILAAHGLGTIAGPIFRLGLTPEGRTLAKNMFLDGPPKWGDKAKLMAVQNFLQAQDFNEERKKQMRQMARPR